ncbi:hypothetical protein FALBO_7549 [Fusarium albosuccineum]|uniref:2EXR domain-containing protein n=1 Tax=Fusarium albosuccineum TaxID=1237068 RepID=A0A8H4PCC8_9HYPO|nr:hypothetical protein FALBO_7549 [Fusarium albosuccineum]
MALTQFHLFRQLPLELRREIYLLATPPRIVHVQEGKRDEDDYEGEYEDEYDEFADKLRTNPVHIKLDKSLLHFAFNWRRHVPRRDAQSTLEYFGFASTKQRYQPWETSASAPEIPLHWLSERPDLAWEFMRESHLYSSAPIPALLHTWSESRAVLRSQGYELTFRTRSTGPRTWFNFKRDTLFLRHDSAGSDGNHGVLTGGPWDVGQFDPGDMQRVQRLALDRSTQSLYDVFSSSNTTHYFFNSELSSLLRLFGGIKELLLIEWMQELLDDWFQPGSYAFKYVPLFGPAPDPNRKQAMNTTQKLWYAVDVAEVDAAMRPFNDYPFYRGQMISVGEEGRLLTAFKAKNGNADYFEETQLALENRLAQFREHTLTEEAAHWEIPKVRAVHVLSRSGHLILSRERQRVMQDLRKLQQEWKAVLKSKNQRHAACAQNPTVVACSSSSQWDNDESFETDDERAFAEAHWPERQHHGCSCGQFNDDDMATTQRKWWIQEGPVPAMGDLLFE